MDLVISLLHRNEEMSLVSNRSGYLQKYVMYAVEKRAIFVFIDLRGLPVRNRFFLAGKKAVIFLSDFNNKHLLRRVGWCSAVSLFGFRPVGGWVEFVYVCSRKRKKASRVSLSFVHHHSCGGNQLIDCRAGRTYEHNQKHQLIRGFGLSAQRRVR